jgi:primosomal protein N' (replication factor Y)
MATPRLFRLKSEVIAKPAGEAAHDAPIARIWVETGVDHLDQPYDYLVPQEMSSRVSVGIRVQIPFSHHEVEGIVISRHSSSQTGAKLKSITKVLSNFPVATPSSLKLYERVANYFSASTSDVLRSAIPPRVASVEKGRNSYEVRPHEKKRGKQRVEFLALAPHISPLKELLALIDLTHGSSLVIVPDERDLFSLALLWGEDNPGNEAIILGSSLSRSERYENYLDALSQSKRLVIGTRSAVFAPVANLSSIIVYKESSPDYFDPRSPGWNVGDVARMRASDESVDLLFVSYVPSLNIAREIDQRRIKYIHESHRLSVRAFTPLPAQLLPDRIFQPVRDAIKKGPVLFLVSRKGYASALICGQCRNFALCACGGRVKIVAGNKPPQCSHCAQEFPLWRCAWCKSDKQYAGGRGIDRASEEIGRAFPNVSIISSSGESIKNEVADDKSIVIATPGAQPITKNGYSAVVILNALAFFSHDDLCAGERAREMLFETCALVRKDGQILMAIDDAHPIIAAVTQWNPATMIQRELRERLELGLPPFERSAYLRVASQEATQLVSGLRSSITSGRLNSTVSILGPVELGNSESKIILRFNEEDHESTANFLRELQRKRGIAKKPLLYIRITPYSLA